MGYLSAAPGPPRLVADAILIGLLQALALGRTVHRLAWIGVTVAAIALALVTGTIVVVGMVALLGPLVQQANADLYGGLLYVVAAATAGVIGGAVQAPLLRGLRTAPWLAGNALGAPFAFPALALSWFSPENITGGLPLWLVGLAGGAVYGLATVAGLTRGLDIR